MSTDRKSPYKSYKQSMVTAVDHGALDRWKIILLKGNSDFLITHTLKALKKAWESGGWVVERVEGSQVNAEVFFQAYSATSLFEPKVLTLFHDAQSIQDVLNMLALIKTAKDIKNPILLVWRGKEPLAKVQKEFQRLGPLTIACEEPAPWEFKDFLQDRARAHGLKITPDATDIILESIGNNLFKLDNELARLSLMFLDHGAAINAQDLRPLMGFMREDHVFKLDQLLCQEFHSKALLLVTDLLERGESPLGLLAILAMHCRKALQIQSGIKAGQNSAELARNLKLPPTVVQSYVGYVQKRTPLMFQKALRLCHELDKKFKSRSLEEDLALSTIIFELKMRPI